MTLAARRRRRPLAEDGWVLPYAYAKVVLEAEVRPWREHYAVFWEPVGELERGHI